MLMSNFFASIFGFIAGTLSWFATNCYGRSLKRFWDLQFEIQIALQTLDDCARLASQLDALQSFMPPLIGSRYDLGSAARSLRSLSELHGNDSHEIADLRVQVQEFLRLPVDPKDRKLAERIRRLKDAKF